MLDFLGDGFISRVDFKLVLEEFGMKCQAMDLEHFFAKYVPHCTRTEFTVLELVQLCTRANFSNITHSTLKNFLVGLGALVKAVSRSNSNFRTHE